VKYVKAGGQEGQPPPLPLGRYSGKFENIGANLKMRTFLFLEITLILSH